MAHGLAERGVEYGVDSARATSPEAELELREGSFGNFEDENMLNLGCPTPWTNNNIASSDFSCLLFYLQFQGLIVVATTCNRKTHCPRCLFGGGAKEERFRSEEEGPRAVNRQVMKRCIGGLVPNFRSFFSICPKM